ncbi:hypothetical protein Pint_16185 [Pistacia integerrima]|uniref:Uncharacterized protein n=1 Tax=Pistacia integerrima TaxID=434235 RepID=A0ACC0ZG68_9ROSI|nr:hypothetical protein Pint_16185 [Pistacia integerrima]
MTEERINILGIADIIKHEASHRTSNSTGKVDNLNGGSKIFSRYLRPSFGSCHDFCKYGEERALEIKARGRISISNTETLAEGLRKKKLALSRTHSLSLKARKLDDHTVKREVSSSTLKGTNGLVRHNTDPKMKLKLPKRSSLPNLRYSIGEGDRKIRKSKDIELFKLDVCIDKGVVSSPLKETDFWVKHASNPMNKPMLPHLSKQSSLPIHICSNGGGDRKARNSKETKISKRDEAIVDAFISAMSKEETVLVSSPLKEKKIDVSVKHAFDPKRKSNLSKQSSLPTQRFSNGGGDRSRRKSHEMNLLMSPPGSSSIKTKVKSKNNRSKDMRSSGKGKGKVAEPSSVSSSAKLPLMRSSSWNVKNSKHLNEISRVSKKTRRKPEPEQTRREDLTENTLPVVGQNAEEKNLTPIKNDVPAIDLSPSSPAFPDDKIFNTVQNGTRTAQLTPPSGKWNSRRSEKKIHATQSRRSWPPSSKRKSSRATRLGTRSDTSSLASLSMHSETELENQISVLEKELKNRRRKGRTTSLKDDSDLGQRLAFRRGKVIDLQPVDITPRRLKFKQRAFGDSENGITDASWKAVGKKNLRHSRKRIYARSTQKRIYARRTQNKNNDTQSLPSRPSSPKEKDLQGTPFGTGVARSYTSSLASWSSHGYTSSINGETDTEILISDLEKEFENRHKKGGTISLKDECGPILMLSFRRGKVIELQPEDNTPRRLKFRQRAIGDNQDGEGDDDVSLKTREKRESEGDEVGGSETESKNDVLRQQDVIKEEKNRGINLSNNVIEETVSELVKTRKSKVKALVGAFENLISLLDTKTVVTD